jgi:hypothetical protein
MALLSFRPSLGDQFLTSEVLPLSLEFLLEHDSDSMLDSVKFYAKLLLSKNVFGGILFVPFLYEILSRFENSFPFVCIVTSLFDKDFASLNNICILLLSTIKLLLVKLTVFLVSEYTSKFEN